MRAGYAIIQAFLSHDKNLTDQNLLIMKHKLYVELLKGGRRTASKVGDVSEQALLGLSLLPSGDWIKAKKVRGYVCCGLWSFRTTFANWARVQDSDYFSPNYSKKADHSPNMMTNRPLEENIHDQASTSANPGALAPEDPEMFEENDGMDDEDMEGVLIHGFDSIQLQNVDVDESEDRTHVAEELDKYVSRQRIIYRRRHLVLRFIKSNRSVIEADDAITPFGRLRLINSVLYTHSVYQPPFSSTFDNGVFTISNSVDSPFFVPLQKIKLCLLSSQQRLFSAIKNVLPVDMNLSTFPFHRIHDDYSAIPLHLQSHNLTILQPYLASCWTGVLNGCLPSGKKLMEDLRFDRTEVDQWLDDCNRCLSLACAPIFLSTGGANFASLRHQQYSGQKRSIFLLKDGSLAFMNHSLHLNGNSGLKLITVTHELSQYLLLLLLVVLPISTKMRTSRGQHHPYALTHVWVTYHMRSHGSGDRWLFNEAQINTELESVSKDVIGVPLTSRNLYHLVFGVLRKEFPGLFAKLDQNFRSPVDDAAQHRYQTGAASYGRLSVFPKSHHLIGDHPWRNLTICQLWQASLGCTTVNDTWKELVEHSSLFTYHTFQEEIAFQKAREEVLSTYQISSRPTQERSALANSILKSLPFLTEIKVTQYLIIMILSMEYTYRLLERK